MTLRWWARASPPCCNVKAIPVISVGVAVLAAAIAAIVVSGNRADAARANEAAAESEAAKAEAEVRAAEKNEAAESARARTAADNAKAAEIARETEKLAKERAADEAKTARENRLEKEAEAESAKAKAKEASETREAEAQKAKAAKLARDQAALEAKTAEERRLARAAEAETAKAKSAKAVSEAKLKELQKIDFLTWQRDLAEREQAVAERERALQPEKTIADLDWAGGKEDTVFDAEGKLCKQVKVPYLAENDCNLPAARRELAKSDRLDAEARKARSEDLRNRIVSELESKYVQAIRESRPIDAAYYRKSLKSIYPDWKYQPKDESEKPVAEGEGK